MVISADFEKQKQYFVKKNIAFIKNNYRFVAILLFHDIASKHCTSDKGLMLINFFHRLTNHKKGHILDTTLPLCLMEAHTILQPSMRSCGSMITTWPRIPVLFRLRRRSHLPWQAMTTLMDPAIVDPDPLFTIRTRRTRAVSKHLVAFLKLFYNNNNVIIL